MHDALISAILLFFALKTTTNYSLYHCVSQRVILTIIYTGIFLNYKISTAKEDSTSEGRYFKRAHHCCVISKLVLKRGKNGNRLQISLQSFDNWMSNDNFQPEFKLYTGCWYTVVLVKMRGNRGEWQRHKMSRNSSKRNSSNRGSTGSDTARSTLKVVLSNGDSRSVKCGEATDVKVGLSISLYIQSFRGGIFVLFIVLILVFNRTKTLQEFLVGFT